jgi:molecular chaperone GrpE
MDTMTDTTANAPESQPVTAEPAPEAATPDPAAALAKEVAETKDRLLRTLADMENLRRRTEREVADARQYGIANFARDMVGVADNMQRALETLAVDARAKADGSLKALIDGVELTERELLKTLEKHGVKKIDPQGQKFDPNFHQAMFEMPDPNFPSGTVAQVVQSGFMIGDRMLRPALVGVSKGAPKTAPSENAGG